MMNNFTKRVLAKPGRYVVTNPIGLLLGARYLMEVDEDGRAWQLNPKGERDGELLPDGWVGSEIFLDPRCLPDDEPGMVH